MSVKTFQDIIPLQLYLTRLGELYCSSRWSSKNGTPKTASTRLYCIEEGSGWLRTDKQEILLEPGYAYLIPSNLYHEYGCSGMRKMYFIFTVRSPYSNDLLRSLDRIYKARYDPKDLQGLLDCYEKDDCYSLMQLRMYITKITLQVLQENGIPSPSVRPQSALVAKAVDYINTHTYSNLSVKELCEALFVSESKLRAAFLKEKNIRIGRYIDNCVMNKAKKLLADPQRSIGQISDALNFCDQFYFSRQFKNRFGVTPSAYRRSLNK